MKKTIAAACAIALGFASLGVGAFPAAAASIHFNSGVQFGNAQDYDIRNESRFERRGHSYYLNGQRGQREQRSGWRQYNGFYFPQSAFSLSLQFGNSEGNVRVSSTRHRDYCEDRYISYRASDNTFQPYHGARQECVAPFDN